MESLFPTARMVARLVGTVISVGLGIGPIGRLRTRMLCSDICEASFWDEKIKLSNGAFEELLFWKHCFDQFNGQPIWPVSPDVAVVTYSDASVTGWGGFSVNVNGTMAKGNFTAEESEESSAFRELKATLFVLQPYIHLIKGKVIKHRSDNMNVTRILLSDSKKVCLHNLALEIFKLCFQNGIQLHSEWVPRSPNQISDEISKDIDKADFMLNPDIFADIIWGPHTIDRVSSFKTRQVPRFCSRWLSPFMEYLDAFSASWQGENNWLFPPASVVSRVIKHLMFSKADATLVVPFWPSAPWWPCLTMMVSHLDQKL